MIRTVIAIAGLSFAGHSGADVERAALEARLTYGYGYDASLSMQGLLELAAGLEVSTSDSTSVVASGRFRLDAADDLEPGRPTRSSYSKGSQSARIGDNGTAELRDFYIELRSENGLTRVGKQQIVWGRLDGIKVLDLVNPQNFREFIMEDFGDSRIGLWSAYFDYSFGAFRGELAIVPDGTGHAIPDPGSWFELSAPRFRYGVPAGQPTPAISTESPGHGAHESALGLRISRAFSRLEVSAVGYTGIDPEPLGRLISVEGSPVLERYYKRRDAFGFSAETGIGPMVLRTEYAFQPGRAFNAWRDGRLTTVNIDQHRGAIAFDLDAPLGLFVNAQYLVDTLENAPAGLVRPRTDRVGTLFLRRTFLYDALTVGARWYHSFGDGDNLAALRLEYSASDATTLSLAVEAFSGSDAGLFGQFSERDRIVVGIEHTF